MSLRVTEGPLLISSLHAPRSTLPRRRRPTRCGHTGQMGRSSPLGPPGVGSRLPRQVASRPAAARSSANWSALSSMMSLTASSSSWIVSICSGRCGDSPMRNDPPMTAARQPSHPPGLRLNVDALSYGWPSVTTGGHPEHRRRSASADRRGATQGFVDRRLIDLESETNGRGWPEILSDQPFYRGGERN